MHIRQWIYACVVTVFCIFPAPAKEANWLKLSSEHFEIYSAENEKKAQKVLEHLERVRKAFELLTKVQITNDESVRVLLFRNEREYREYAYGQFSLAHYMSARGRDYIVLSDFDNRTERVLNHEYFHLFSKHANFHFPVWMEEGLADFYSTLEITKRDVSLGLPVVNHHNYLNSLQGRPMPLAQIVAVDHKNRHDGDRSITERLYAQGWALIHMTFAGKDMSGRSQKFFEAVRDGDANTAEAYQSVYGLSLAELDQRLARYIQQGAYYYGKTPAEGLDFTAPTEAQTIEDWETPLLLADMLAYTRKNDQATQRYAELAEQFPDRPEVEESRGYLAWQSGDRAAPIPFFRAAAAKKSKNSMLYYQLAALACDYRTASAECSGWINEALRLDPENKQARTWAVGYALNTQDFNGAVAYLVRSGKVTTSEAPDFFHKLAYAQYQLQKWSDARAAVQRGLSFAKKPEDQAKLNDLSRHIVAAESYQTQLKEARSGTYPPADTSQDAPTVPGAPEAPREPTAAQRARTADSSHAMAPTKSTADRIVEQFILTEGSVLTAATMDALECEGALPAALVKVNGALLRLAIDNPGSIRVIQDGNVVVDHEFVCGKQKPQSLLVGYLKEGAPKGSDGLLRILSFQ